MPLPDAAPALKAPHFRLALIRDFSQNNKPLPALTKIQAPIFSSLASDAEMSNQDVLKTEPESAEDESKYMIHSKMEIVHILRAIQQKNALVTAYFNHGNDFILTSILHVDPERGSLILDFGSEEASNRRILESEKILFVTVQDRVKVQFAAEHVEKTLFLKRDAFRAKLPPELLKLQRRDFYRLATPITSPLKCEIQKKGGGKAEVAVADISLGGIAISGFSPELGLEAGDTYEGCRIALPDIGAITAAIQIKSIYEITTKSGIKTNRAGCQFLDLPASAQAMIQRYIIKLDRERRAKLAED